MEKSLRKGDVVVLPFPFSDLTKSRRRPALITATLEGDDLILCQITSKAKKDKYSVILNDNDFLHGNLNQPSTIRPNRIFTADHSIIEYKIGSLKKTKIKKVEQEIIKIFSM